MSDTLSRNARDLVQLRRALYGAASAKRLLLAAFRLSKASRVSERTILRAWDAIDAELTEGEQRRASALRDASSKGAAALIAALREGD